MLPFIAGLATGVVAVVAYKNKSKIKQKLEDGACETKKLAQTGLEKSKERLFEIKSCIEQRNKDEKVIETSTLKEELNE